MKEGLRRLLAAGAKTPAEARELISRITDAARFGTRPEVETMKIWPDDDNGVRPASDFFVNERIDLLIREAEAFRNDYRNAELSKSKRNVFLSLKKYVGDTEVDTLDFAVAIQLLLVIGCGIAAGIILSAQNRRTH